MDFDADYSGHSGGPSTSGKIHHGLGLTKPAPDYKPVSSIPSKFETVLFTGPREKKGFGSVSRRFGDSEKDNPGPGEYVALSSLEYKHDSISKKGFGPMASRDKRWRGQRVIYTGPGPGEFEARSTFELVRDKYFNKAPATSAFHPPEGKTLRASDPADDGPGPGAYVCEDTTRTGQSLTWDSSNHTYVSAFKATPHKLALMGNLDAPPPTKYTLVRFSQEPEVRGHAWADAWDPKSSSNHAASRTPSHAGLSSFAGKSAAPSLAHMNPAMFLEDPKAPPKKPDTGPGPGSYELQYFESVQSNLQKVAGKTSANFQRREYTDRFGRSLAAPAPTGNSAGSPGTTQARRDHSPVARISSPTPGVAAPFKSQVPGRAEYDLKEATKAPGPAFYSPAEPPKRQSYHLNARKRGFV